MGELKQEFALFEQVLPRLLPQHLGEFALFCGGKVVELYQSYREAYIAGLDRFGLDGGFLIAEVKEQEARPVSVSWQSGVMFDPK